jgi:hypothetical protein
MCPLAVARCVSTVKAEGFIIRMWLFAFAKALRKGVSDASPG